VDSPNAIGFALIAAAILIAFTLHNTVVRFLRRQFGARFPYAVSLLGTARRVTRFALMLFAASAVLPLAPLDQNATTILGKSLLLGTTVLIGWVALVAAELAADLYLLRFRLDTETICWRASTSPRFGSSSAPSTRWSS